MKRIALILLVTMFLIPVFLEAQDDELTNEEVIENVVNLKDVAVGIFKVGFVRWFKGNWYFFILSLVGGARIVVKITPSKKDDIWFKKWILAPFRLFSLSFGTKNKEDN